MSSLYCWILKVKVEVLLCVLAVDPFISIESKTGVNSRKRFLFILLCFLTIFLFFALHRDARLSLCFISFTKAF